MSFQQQKKRAMTPKGQMSGNGSGPAIMMMPPHIRATFMPPPPLKHLPPFKRHVLMSDNYVTDDDNDNEQQHDIVKKEEGVDNNNNKVGPSGIAKIPTSFPKLKRGAGLSGVSSFLHHFERTSPPSRTIHPTPNSIKDDKIKAKKDANEAKLAPLIEAYRKEQKDCSGEFTNGMNCYNTLFVGRLAYEVTERKLLREMETYGPIKDLKLITNKKTGESRGYAFVEYENEEDMKRAFRGADGMRIEGRPIVVDVERGHTVPNWLPRKFGGGLGGKNMTYGVGRAASNPGNAQQMNSMGGPPMGMGGGPPMGGGGYGSGPPMGMGGGYGGPPQMHGGRGGPPPMMGRGGGPPMGFNDRGRDGYGDRGGGYNGPPPPGYGGDRGRSYGGGYGGDSRGGYRDNNRGPPQGSYGGSDRDRRDSRSGGLAWERGGSQYGGGGDRDRDRKRRRSRSRSPDHHRRRGRY